VHELQGKTITEGATSRKNAAPVSSTSCPDRVDNLILLLILLKGPLSHFYNKRVTNTLTRTRGALPPARWRKGTTMFIGQCGFGGLADQIHKSIKLQ